MKTYGVNGIQTFTWDAMRRKTQDTDNNSGNQTITMGYEFDKLSRMTKQTEKIGSGTTQNVSKLYDVYGRRTRITYPHGRNVDTTYTALHQVNEIKTDVGSGIQTVANYDYLYDSGSDKRPLVSKNTLHSGTDTRVDFAYDSMGRVTKKNWVDISASTTLSGFEYTYNLFGNRLTDNQLDRSQDSQTYYYDTAQRFTKMERGTIGGTPSFYQGYTLDALANWSSFNNNGSSESRTHNSMNAITVRGSTSLTYDSNGNLTNDGNQKYIWDSLNRLVEVRDSSNNIICDYYYNANNLRVEKHHAGGAKEQFYYDGATVLVETDGSQTKVREYVNGGQYIDEVILVVNGSTYNYYMSDLRYCVTGFIDSTGAVVERARYDGYGKRTLLDTSYATITTANVDQSYGYTGIRHDNESGLQYYRARYFDNYLGRFINHDPLGYVDGLNMYRGFFVCNGTDSWGLYASTTAVYNLVDTGKGVLKYVDDVLPTFGSARSNYKPAECQWCSPNNTWLLTKPSVDPEILTIANKIEVTINPGNLKMVCDRKESDIEFTKTHERKHMTNYKEKVDQLINNQNTWVFSTKPPCITEANKINKAYADWLEKEAKHESKSPDPVSPTPSDPVLNYNNAINCKPKL